MEEVKTFLNCIFADDDVQTVLTSLEEMGAESMDDIVRVNVESDLGNVLPVLKRRRLSDKIEELKHSNKCRSIEEWERSGTPIHSLDTEISSAPLYDSGDAQNVTPHSSSGATPSGSSSSTLCSPSMIHGVSIMAALAKHPDCTRIIESMKQPVPDMRLHGMMVKAACSHLINCCGRYPPPSNQLAMAVDIVTQFPERAVKSGKGHELYYCQGSGKGYITNRLREIYRRYPTDQKKYQPRRISTAQAAEPFPNVCLTDYDYSTAKTQLSHLIYSEQSESEIVEKTRLTLGSRRKWIEDNKPSVAAILKEFPRLTDTPLLMSLEFHWIQPTARQTSSVYLQTVLAMQVLKYCKLNGKFLDLTSGVDIDNPIDQDSLVKTAVICLVRLLPTMGKHRVSPVMAMRYILDEISDPMTLDEAIQLQKETNEKINRSQPYLLLLGSTIFLFADDCPVIVRPQTLAVSFDLLLKSYFVFNVTYPKQVMVLYNFLQHVVLGIEAKNLSTTAMKLASEFEKML